MIGFYGVACGWPPSCMFSWQIHSHGYWRYSAMSKMLDKETLTLEEIRRIGLDTLTAALGVEGTLRFLQLFDNGTGNYSEDRQQWLGDEDIDTIVARIERRRLAAQTNAASATDNPS